MNSIQTKLSGLKPLPIDVSKCTQSLIQQIVNSSQQRLNDQEKQFNLGNGQTFADPFQAADYLLEREYGETSLFMRNRHEPVFIPPVFRSGQYSGKSTVAVLDYNIVAEIKRTLDNLVRNSSDFWFTPELQALVQNQADPGEINGKDFTNWTLNIKIMHLIKRQGATEMTLPSSMLENKDFIQDCIDKINRKQSPNLSQIYNLLTTCKTASNKTIKTEVEQQLEIHPIEHPILKWILALNLSDQGEKLEHWLFDQLNRESESLVDTVILQSVTFQTDLRNKKHQEIDLLIFSWSRKLILAIEAKRSLTSETAFDQINKYHKLFEEKLSDQLDSGWTYLPVVCVEKPVPNVPENDHYITMETDVGQWLSKIFQKFPELPPQVPCQSPLQQLKKMLRMIVFIIHISKKDQTAPITTSNWVDYISDAIEAVSTVDNINFYSADQLAVFDETNQRYKRLIIEGAYGTGKSFLLQEKAKLLSKKKEFKGKVVYVLVTVGQHKLHSKMYYRLKRDLNPYGITVNEIKSWAVGLLIYSS